MDRSELKALVPHGYGKLIAQKAGVNQMTVSAFLNGKNDNVVIELTTLKMLAELSEQKKALIEKIKG